LPEARIARLPIGIDGPYPASAGCHGGPGITFKPGYDAAYQALDDIG
jgi:phytoene dehydrogenase-like protein